MSSMKERPILMNGAMVRATLAGIKTQTRRAIGLEYFSENDPDNWKCVRATDGIAQFVYKGSPVERPAICRFGKPGDRLWVRESWRTVAGADDIAPRNLMNVEPFTHYEADESSAAGMGKLRPGMFMPRWASRLILEIPRVRVERLQDISHTDAIAEGVESIANNYGNGAAYRDYSMKRPEDTTEWFACPIRSFQTLWESINGAGSWDANPWIWVVEFKKMTGLYNEA